MRKSTVRWGPAFAAAVICLSAGCSRGKPPEEVERERARANAEWNAQVAAVERERQEEEHRLVREQMAEHNRQEQFADERVDQAEAAAQKAEQERLIALVQAQFADPTAVKLAGVHWNSTKSAICGEASGVDAKGNNPGYRHFIASGDAPVIDSADDGEHTRFAEAAQAIDCGP
jgi:hypothetical protein